jgi:hypothetical protein
VLTERTREKGNGGSGMSFCTACGRERAGASHFCDGCGAEFGESADRAGAAPSGSFRPAGYGTPETGSYPYGPGAGGWTAGRSSDGTASQRASGAATSPDAGIGLLDSLLTPPDPSWDDWYVHPVQSAQPAGEEQGPVHRSSSWRKRILIALAAGVVGVAFSGAAAIELSHGHARPGVRAGRSGGAEAHSRTPRAGASLAPGGANKVAVASSAAGSTALPQVMALLRRYFSAINGHDYAAYAQLLDAQVLRLSPASAFSSGYGSTSDSDETLTGISALSSGGVAAAVTFTSHQQPAESPDHSACNEWSITLFLVPQGAGYLIGLPPSWYQASYTSC